MGSWSVGCGISNIAITSGNECAIIPLQKTHEDYGGYLPFMLPIFGRYNDYGGMEDIVEDENTKLIESYLGITIAEFVEFLVDGKHTYDRREVDPIKKKLKASGKLEEAEKYRFMWVDKQVYDVIIKNYNEFEKGYHDFGTPTMLDLLGFKLVEDADITNYDPKRFNKKYQKGDLFVYSDGRTMLSENGQYIFYTDKGCGNSLATYIKIPDELLYLKGVTSDEAWRLLTPKDQKKKLGYVFGRSSYSDLDDFLDKMESKGVLPKELKVKPLYNQYFDNMEEFGDKIMGLTNVRRNMHVMSGRFFPHVLHLTPQCGEYKQHQILLEEFCKINESYIGDEEE